MLAPRVVLGLLVGAFTLLGDRADHVATAASFPPAQAYALSAVRSGTLRVLTYNVAGLPALVSAEDPARTIPQISPLLNGYDLVLAQEDFAYQKALGAKVRHPFRALAGRARRGLLGDGLSAYADFPLVDVQRVPWRTCNGVLSAWSDCLADKGFFRMEAQLAQGTTLHIYNLHADAGRRAGDRRARIKGFAQLAAYIHAHSKDQALIVAGDTNLRAEPRDHAILRRFLRATGLVDTCRALRCGHDGYDKVFVRSTNAMQLTPTLWRHESRFKDPSGRPLSDHPAVRVDIDWKRPVPG